MYFIVKALNGLTCLFLQETKNIDIMINDAVAESRVTAVDAMKNAILNERGVICWGNTNLMPSFYKDILGLAAKYKRVVRFVRW